MVFLLSILLVSGCSSDDEATVDASVDVAEDVLPDMFGDFDVVDNEPIDAEVTDTEVAVDVEADAKEEVDAEPTDTFQDK